MHPTCSGEFYYDSGFYDPQFSCLIFVPVASSSVYIDEDFSILGALSLDVFVISFKATVPDSGDVWWKLPMLYVSRDHHDGKSIWRLL